MHTARTSPAFLAVVKLGQIAKERGQTVVRKSSDSRAPQGLNSKWGRTLTADALSESLAQLNVLLAARHAEWKATIGDTDAEAAPPTASSYAEECADQADKAAADPRVTGRVQRASVKPGRHSAGGKDDHGTRRSARACS